ncbi:3-oxoacyl-[acyl-carrier protein] reductase [Marisediminicola sp. UYEF4]|uniref:SDR family oxidoreductase n=1 Tax=Marisediminicola sp. UYEF4 TaxID=1756384 RepID=UPI003390F1C5
MPPPPASALSSDLPLLGRGAIVTGVSRRRGIGFAVAVRLAELGANVFIHHYSPNDAEQPWGADDLDEVRAGIRSALVDGALFGDLGADMADPLAPSRIVDAAVAAIGPVRILISNHAKSGGDGSLFDMTPDSLDVHWHVNTRSTLLLTRHFAEQFSGAAAGERMTAPGVRSASLRPVDEFATGRVIWMTSGQHDGPMPGEVAYATSKAALAGITATVASELLDRGILLNTVNPGPVNTGYLDPETTDRPLDDLLAQLATTPFGRFGLPGDPARLISWLVSDEARWVVGQVLTTDGGFRL